LVESTFRVHVGSEWALAIGATQRGRFDPIQCAYAHSMSNRLIVLWVVSDYGWRMTPTNSDAHHSARCIRSPTAASSQLVYTWTALYTYL